MTAEEALHICKLATKCAMLNQQCTDMTEFIDAMKQKYDLEVMVGCIQKQIPKKPTREKYGHTECACCGWVVESFCGDLEQYPFCPNCGQAIDWED